MCNWFGPFLRVQVSCLWINLLLAFKAFILFSSPAEADFDYQKLKSEYRNGKITDKQFWEKMQEKNDFRARPRSNEERLSLALLAKKEGYTILASQWSAEAIDGYDKSNSNLKAWKVFFDSYSASPVQDVAVNLSLRLSQGPNAAPYFGRNWAYIQGLGLKRRGEGKKAREKFLTLKPGDDFYVPANYQLSVMLMETGEIDKAITTLRKIVALEKFTEKNGTELVKVLAGEITISLARLFYEKRKFELAIRLYRSIPVKSELFYDAQFEQAWAFFMAGYPNFALGALHGADSPMFNHVFNPEIEILRSIIFYWICQYNDARNALASFVERHKEPIETMTRFLDRKVLREQAAYQLLENFLLGVSPESLGIDYRILQTATNAPKMKYLRNQYADIIDEHNRMSVNGFFNSKLGLDDALTDLEKITEKLRINLGATLIKELEYLKANYENIKKQAEFLYVELLMSQKDQLLGKELHADSKITTVSDVGVDQSYGDYSQAWAASKVHEYWKDEIGYYKYEVKPQCRQ